MYTYISSTDILSTPMDNACCFPSATTVTISLALSPGVMMAPFDVKPGHMIFAPDKTNFNEALILRKIKPYQPKKWKKGNELHIGEYAI
ncbi:hypothetical protein BLOT_003848 [Blomia tropicalis]|nr:hypothetical protein BLOT_003848 [Blomia tropicalis]